VSETRHRVLLTGASGAIGSETAKLLAVRGAHLALSGRRAGRLEELAAEIEAGGSERPVVITADLSRRGEATRLADEARSALGAVDVLINNAGGSVQGLTWAVGDRDEARAMMETNLWSPFALAAALAPEMLERGTGAIVNVGSMARISPFPHLGHYSASRAALSTATQVLAMELAPRGIRVVEVALGPVDSPASRENRRLAGADAWLDGRPGLGRPESAARAIADAAIGDARGVTYYPRALRFADRFPGLGRRYSRRTARGADLGDETVRA
jgi:short-subunit dehydrogenase